jgi:hypothetical protein
MTSTGLLLVAAARFIYTGLAKFKGQPAHYVISIFSEQTNN